MRVLLGLWLIVGLIFPLQVSADNFLDQGINDLNRNDLKSAIDRFTVAIPQFPAIAYSNRCLAYLLLQSYEEAQCDCTTALTFLPNNLEILLNLGLSNYYQAKYTEAIANFTQGIEKDISDFRFYYNRGLAYAAIGDSLKALKDYNFALQYTPNKNPLRATIFTDRGVERMVMGEYEVSVSDFDRAIEIDASYTQAFFNRGCAKQHLGLLKESLNDFDRFIASAPQNPEGYKARAMVLRQLGNLQDAISDLDLAANQFLSSGKWDEYELIQILLRQWLPDRVT